MGNDLNIPKDGLITNNQKIVLPNDNQLKKAVIPQIKLGIPDPTAQIKKADANLIISSFALPYAQTEIYRGRIPIIEKDKPLRQSKLGTPVFSDLQFISIGGGSPHVPVDTVLFNVSQVKNIVKTSIQGRDGEIKEYIGLSDYEINIKGVICGDNGVYPFDHVKNLVDYCRYPQSLGIVSKFLNDMFDIQEVVIKDFAFEQSEGSQSYQKFEINCWSEKPVEVLIQEGN